MSDATHITEDDVRHVARLSRLKLDDDKVRQFASQLERVLEHVSKINELDVENVEPMAHAMDFHNVLRDDQPKPGLSVDEALTNAPDKAPPFFKVPKVLGDGSGA